MEEFIRSVCWPYGAGSNGAFYAHGTVRVVWNQPLLLPRLAVPLAFGCLTELPDHVSVLDPERSGDTTYGSAYAIGPRWVDVFRARFQTTRGVSRASTGQFRSKHLLA